MKIELEYPYNYLYIYGYIVESQGRKSVVLYNNHTDRTTISLARYKMSVHLGRLLTDNEQVDHIDNKKWNDNIDNLQILSLKENNRKEHCREIIELICPICKTKFYPKKNQFWKKERCCSRKCGYVQVSRSLKNNKTKYIAQ